LTFLLLIRIEVVKGPPSLLVFLVLLIGGLIIALFFTRLELFCLRVNDIRHLGGLQ